MIRVLFILVCILSLLSQLPDLIGTGIGSMFKVSWILPLVVLIISTPKYFNDKRIIGFFVFALIFTLYCFGLEAFTNVKYVGDDVYNIWISLLIFTISFVFGKKYCSDLFLEKLSLALLIVGLILAYRIFVDYLVTSSISEMKYAYDSKNSAGQILLNIGIMVITCFRTKSKILTFLIICALLFLTFVIFYMKSRATLCGFIFVVLYYLVRYRNVKVRVFFGVAIIGLITYTMLNSDVYEVIVNNIFLGSRKANDINAISSGRIGLITKALELQSNSNLFGIGCYYLDSFPIAIFIQYGLIGFCIMLTFIAVVSKEVLSLKTTTSINLAAFLLFAVTMINSLFEAYPPFGSGVKCFLLWVFLGFSLAHRSNIKRAISYNSLNQKICK